MPGFFDDLPQNYFSQFAPQSAPADFLSQVTANPHGYGGYRSAEPGLVDPVNALYRMARNSLISNPQNQEGSEAKNDDDLHQQVNWSDLKQYGIGNYMQIPGMQGTPAGKAPAEWNDADHPDAWWYLPKDLVGDIPYRYQGVALHTLLGLAPFAMFPESLLAAGLASTPNLGYSALSTALGRTAERPPQTVQDPNELIKSLLDR